VKQQHWCSDIDNGSGNWQGGGTAAIVVVRQQSAGEGVGGVGGGVGDESAAVAVLAVGLEGGKWLVRLRPYLSLCKKIVIWGALFCSRERFFAPGSALYCPPLTLVRPVSKIFQV
jgi:hypothetical protein